ncbi:MAG: glycosyltransferase [Staphylococcus sp.]|nr:glycosyltransferase [Staphylococcus sp.]
MKSPVTIVIPVYNREHLVGRTLDSIASQEVKPAGVVLVDNNSTDGTLEVLHEWAKEDHGFDVCVVSEPKAGASAARNRGLREVATDFVMFFDSDDVMLPSHVGDFTAAIAAYGDEVDIFGRSLLIEELDGRRNKHYFTDRSPMFNHIFRGCLSTARIVVRASLVREAGGWNEDLRGWDDYELGVRLLLAGARVMTVKGAPSVLTYRTAESITGTVNSACSERWEQSLDLVESHFRSAGDAHLVRLTDARRMVLASQYRAEVKSAADRTAALNAAKQASRLYDHVLQRTDSPLRMRLVYFHNRCFKRLTWVLVRMLCL